MEVVVDGVRGRQTEDVVERGVGRGNQNPLSRLGRPPD